MNTVDYEVKGAKAGKMNQTMVHSQWEDGAGCDFLFEKQIRDYLSSPSHLLVAHVSKAGSAIEHNPSTSSCAQKMGP